MATLEIGDFYIRTMYLGKAGEVIMGHCHEAFDHLSLCMYGKARINPCDDEGGRDENGDIIWVPKPERGCVYAAPQHNNPAAIARTLVDTLSADSGTDFRVMQAAHTVLGLLAENATQSPGSFGEVAWVNIPKGVAHEIICLMDNTTFMCMYHRLSVCA